MKALNEFLDIFAGKTSSPEWFLTSWMGELLGCDFILGGSKLG